jgi:hypothetical protein
MEIVEASPTIVAQTGPEPIVEAMMACKAFDVVVAGRATTLRLLCIKSPERFIHGFSILA